MFHFNLSHFNLISAFCMGVGVISFYYVHHFNLTSTEHLDEIIFTNEVLIRRNYQLIEENKVILNELNQIKKINNQILYKLHNITCYSVPGFHAVDSYDVDTQTENNMPIKSFKHISVQTDVNPTTPQLSPTDESGFLFV